MARAVESAKAGEVDLARVLREIVEGTAGNVGRAFFRDLVRHLAAALEGRWALVGALVDGSEPAIELLAMWGREEGFAETVRYPLKGTPCEGVMESRVCFHPRGVAGLFPEDPGLHRLGAESYLGVALRDSSGRPIGLVAVLDDRPHDPWPFAQEILSIFATRAAAELERLRAEETLRQSNAALERRVAEHTEELRRANEALRANEERLNGILNTQQTFIGRFDLEGRITYMNEAYAQAFALEIGQSLMARIHPEDAGAAQAAIARVLERPYTTVGECRCDVGGEWRWIRWHGTGIRDAGGAVVEIQGVGIDVTDEKRVESSLRSVHRALEERVVERTAKLEAEIAERKTAEAALRRSEERYRQLIETANEGVWVVDPRGVTTYVNRRITAMMGYTAEEMLGRPMYDFMDEAVRIEAEQSLERRRRGVHEQHDFRFRRKDGSDLWTIISANPILDERGAFVESLAMITDVTARRRVEEALRASEARLRLVLNHVPAVIWTADTEMRCTSAVGTGLLTVGVRPEQLVGISAWEYYGTNDPDYEPIAAWRSALNGVPAGYQREIQPGVFFRTRIEPLREADGSISGIVGLGIDVSDAVRDQRALAEAHQRLEERVESRTRELAAANEQLREREQHFKELAESNRLLLAELDHRVRNHLAGLLSLVHAMQAKQTDADTFSEAMESRLTAMAHVHQLMAGTGWQAVELGTLADSLLKAVGSLARYPTELRIEGRPCKVAPKHTMPLSMILLELFTNSCKYGAHSVPGGRVTLTWACNCAARGGDARVRLTWSESGGPAVTGPVRPSLGTQLVESFTRRELGGRCELSFPEGGVRHVFEFTCFT